MIDLDKYEEAIVFKQELECGGVIAVGRDDLLHIIDRLRQAEKDAARYRFMRDMSDDVDVSRFFHVEISERDAAIDEAMQCSK